VLAAIDDQPRPDRLARQAGAAAAGRDRDAQLAGDLDGGDEVVGGAGDDHAEWGDLVDAGVGAVEAAGQVVEADLAADVLAEVGHQGVAALGREVVHTTIVRHPSGSDKV